MILSHLLKKSAAAVCVLSSALLMNTNSATAIVPKPDHVVICILENHSFNQIIGSASAPYINSLLPISAQMQEYYGLTHPSQPNYLMLFSGSDQGEATDNLPQGTPWTTPNLGGSMINAGLSFAAYSEGLPTQGSTVASSGTYARKHCPWVNWQGTGLNQIPQTSNLSMTDFPLDYSTLPDLAFVIPNQSNDMHNGSDPAKISTGDAWLEASLKPYIDWAQANNSLFILTFDEDNFTNTNHIPCLIVGPMVVPGEYYITGYTHYDMLRTLEDMFGLPYAGNSSNATPIEEIWSVNTSVSETASQTLTTSVFPNPVSETSQILVNNQNKNNNNTAHLLVYDVAGRVSSEQVIELLPGVNTYPFKRDNLTSGIYTYQLKNENDIFGSGKVVID